MKLDLLALLRFPFSSPKALYSLCPSAPQFLPHKWLEGTNKKYSPIKTLPPLHLLAFLVRKLCSHLHGTRPMPNSHFSPTSSSGHSSFLFQFCEALCMQGKETAMGETECSQPPQPQSGAYEDLAVRSEIWDSATIHTHVVLQGWVPSAHHRWEQNSQSTLPSRVIYGLCHSSRLNHGDSWSVQQHRAAIHHHHVGLIQESIKGFIMVTSLQRQKEKQRKKETERVSQEWKIHTGFLKTWESMK